MLSDKSGGESKLADIRPRPVIVSPGTLEKDQEYELRVRVFPGEDQAEVDVCLNGKPYLRWQGAQSDIRVPTNDIWNVKLPDDRTLGFALHNCQVLFKSAKLRMISGKARILK
jgi:hypothetical protein